MKDLLELEMGMDANKLGFPSISNCRAIVLVTTGGLIGFHLLGTLTDQKKTAFVNFVDLQPHGAAKLTLYIVSKLDSHTAKSFTTEAKAIATALGFTGPVYAGDATSFAPLGVYLIFDNTGAGTCNITGRAWDNATDSDGRLKVDYDPTDRAIVLMSARRQMYSGLSTAGMQPVCLSRMA